MTDGSLRRRELQTVDTVIDVTAGEPVFIVDADTYRRTRTRYEIWLKPVVDRILAAVLLVACSPLILACAIVIRLNMGGGILLKQVRIGYMGRAFTLYKFRTMRPDRREAARPFSGRDRRVSHKRADDPRITPLGRFLRKWSLDELPQLWNVLRGDMSLIGPRPELPEIVTRYEPWQHRRHSAKPGLTGPWQISQRGNVPLHECTELDLGYVEDLRLMVDLGILVRTPLAVLGRRGF